MHGETPLSKNLKDQRRGCPSLRFGQPLPEEKSQARRAGLPLVRQELEPGRTLPGVSGIVAKDLDDIRTTIRARPQR